MRPLKLTMTAFGPYAQTQEIDFAKLNGRNLFLITGPTGAGKTTIFDGLCFAIYGKASGEERDGENLRSHFVDVETQTVVELDFELKGVRYFIKRLPKQWRKKAKGDGKTEKQAEAELYKYTAEGRELLAVGVSDVNEVIRRIMGIDSDQFRQIVMLPQGDFRKLLTSDSKEREKILQKIFRTEAFKRIEEKLNEQAKNLKVDIGTITTRQMEQIQLIDPNGSLPLLTLIEQEQPWVPTLLTEIQALIGTDDQKKDEFSQLIIKETSKLEAKQAEIFEATQTNAKFQNVRTLDNALTSLQQQKTFFDEEQKQLQLARKAAQLISYEEQFLQRKDERTKRYREREHAELTVQKAEREYCTAETAYQQELALESERSRLHESLTKLNGFKEIVNTADAKKESVRSLKAALDELNQRMAILSTQHEQAQNNAERVTKEIETTRQASEKLAYVSLHLQQKETLAKELHRLLEDCQAMDKLQRDIGQENQIYEAKLQHYQQAKVHYEHLLFLWNAGQAGLLARSLVDGAACLVCGATHHPKPAELPDGIPMEGELKKGEKELEQRRFEKDEQFGVLTTAQIAQKQLQERLYKEISNHPDLGIDPEDTLNWQRQLSIKLVDISKEVNEGRKEVQLLTQEKKKTVELELTLQKTTELLQQASESLQKVKDSFAKTNETYIREDSLLTGMLQQIPEKIRSRGALNTEIHRIGGAYELMKTNLLSAEKQVQTAKIELEKAKSTKVQLDQFCLQSENAYEQAFRAYQEKLQASGFATANEFAAAKLSEQRMEELERKIQQYHQEVKSLQDRYNEALQAVMGHCEVNTEQLQAELDDIKKALDDWMKQKNSLDFRLQKNRQAHHSLTQLAKEKEVLEGEYQVVGELAQMTKGDNPHRLTFERYVLATFLEDILEAANLRLNKMSGNRYQLLRSEEIAKYRGQSGLELMVFDQYTGSTRHVKTLSGGEGFKASLSLALGLADVVQAYAGGISLETMFIDEGFGTLDPESLDNAIATLIELQRGGRLVGIISHVPELKERVDARLEVIATKSGSTVKISIH
jgi:DNA repair protein SbcC/Rad50